MGSLALQPTNEPTEADCRDALEKGLGRARLWAEAGLLSLTELRRACVKDLRYDQQCEDNRADWIWTLLNASKSVDACEDDLWQATADLMADRSAVDRNASHICRLAMKFGQSGRNRFVDQLYALVRNRPEDSDDLTLGEFELISVAGLDGVLVAAKKRGEQLRQTGEDWGDFQLIADAADLYSESAVVEALAASLDKDVQRFFESWRSSLESKGGKVGRESPRQRNSGEAANVDEVLRAAKRDAHCFWLQRWGLRAALDDVSKVLEQILRCEDPDELSRLLRVFALRKLPRIDPVLFQHCRSTHASLNFTALRVLRGNTAPSIRAFALECLNVR